MLIGRGRRESVGIGNIFDCIYFIWCEGEGEVAVFYNRIIESVTPCHDFQVVGPCCESNSFRLTVLAAKSRNLLYPFI